MRSKSLCPGNLCVVNNGIHEKCLSMYCFLSNSIFHSVWVLTDQHSLHLPERLNAHFSSIDSKLSVYEYVTLLEFAIWKLKIMEQIDKNIKLLTPDKKMGCYIDSSTRSM